jgi:glycosyltransferase involved in cell wall biosynthesis
MKNLLVYSYFCPDNTHRPGGVQQLVGPLLQELAVEEGWVIDVVHPRPCFAKSEHFIFSDTRDEAILGSIEPLELIEQARLLESITKGHDVVLSVDRMLPMRLPVPCVLMSNTLAYQTEVNAILGYQWDVVVAPSVVHKKLLLSVKPGQSISVVPYGLPNEMIEGAIEAPPPEWDNYPAVIRLPHRPDRRKGHFEAIRGLAQSLPNSKNIILDISWLDRDFDTLKFRGEIESMVSKLGVSDQVRFSNWLDHEEKREALIKCSAVLQVGSFQESFGLSVVEAVIFGRPAVTLHQPAITETVGKTGLLLEVDDPLRWYETLNRYFHHREKKVNQQRADVIKFLSLRRMANSYSKILMKASGF